MSKSTLTFSQRPDGIFLIEANDTSVETVHDWEETMIAQQDSLAAPVKRIYDLRQLKGVSVFAVRTAVKLKSRPNAQFVYAAVLTHNKTVAHLVNTVMVIQPGGNFQIFTDEDEAVAWLHQKVPD